MQGKILSKATCNDDLFEGVARRKNCYSNTKNPV